MIKEESACLLVLENRLVLQHKCSITNPCVVLHALVLLISRFDGKDIGLHWPISGRRVPGSLLLCSLHKMRITLLQL